MADLKFYTNPQSRGQTVRWMREEIETQAAQQTPEPAP